MSIVKAADKCTGCTACVQRCPKKCITMSADKFGFVVPKVDATICNECGACELTCHALKNENKQNLIKAYYGNHKDDDIRMLSSSGGAVSAIAEIVLADGGVVFGSVYDEVESKVMHTSSKKISFDKQRKSKYVESDLRNTFFEVKKYLDEGVKVLFCGTPCQVSGLLAFVGNQCDNLITLDFICHGVTPITFLNEHLDMLEKRFKSKVLDVNFRPKTFGWSQHAIKITFENGKQYNSHYMLDSYFKGFMVENSFLRSCCYNCEFTNNHKSDIILADFWGVFKYDLIVNDEKGLSLAITNSNKGEDIMNLLKLNHNFKDLDMKFAEYVFGGTKAKSETMEKRRKFLELYERVGFEKAAKMSYMKGSTKFKIKLFIKKLLGKK